MAILGRHRSARSVRTALAGAVALTILATAACGGGGSRASDQQAGGPPVTDQPVQLEVTWWGGPARAELTQKVLDLYTQKHPNVTFTTQWQGYSGYYDKVNTAAAGRNAADIIQIDNRVLREYASKGLLAELDPWVGNTLQVDGIDEKLLSTGKVDDKLYAVPLAANTGATVEDVTAWFEMWAGFRASGAASPQEVAQPANSGDISKNTVLTKQTAGTFSYDNQFTELKKGTDHELLLVPIPGPQTGAYARPSQFFTAYTGGDNIATAVDVINFFVSDPEAGALLGTPRGPPPNKQGRDAISPAFDDQLKYVLAFDERVTAQAGPTPPVPAQGDSQLG